MAKTPLQAAQSTDHGYHHHVVPTWKYIATLVALAALMLLTVGAYYIEIPGFWIFSGTVVNQTVALVIACIKTSLVVFIFMGVWWGTKLQKLWALTGFVWFFLLGLILIDYPMRAYETVQGWEGVRGKAGHGRDGSSLPRVVTPSSQDQPVDDDEINLRPRG